MKRQVNLAGARKDEPEQAGISLEIPTRVFISYRREDTGETAAHLRHSLGRSLGPEKIFRDLDTIQPGQNFETAINEALRSTSVCLVLIGPSWLSLKDDKGRRRLDVHGDYVRAEVEAALRLEVEVIPLRVDGAKVPAQLELGRPVLVRISVQDWWLKRPVLRTGVVELHTNGHLLGSVTGAVLGWDPSKEIVHLLSPWSKWGRGGMGTLTLEAAGKYLDFTDACSIEAVLMPKSPFPSGKRSKPA